MWINSLKFENNKFIMFIKKLPKIEKARHFQILHLDSIYVLESQNINIPPPFRSKLNYVLCKSLRVLENPTEHITKHRKDPLSRIYTFY